MNRSKQIGQQCVQFCGLVVCLIVLNVLFWLPAAAATHTVVGTGTPASCTEAALATALAAGGTVTFNCGNAPHTILLTSSKNLNVDVVIDGDNLITLSGNNATRIFDIPLANTVTLRQITIKDAPASASAIFSSGTLFVVESTFINNLRGAVYNAGGTVSLVSSTFLENSNFSGGAVTNENGGTMTILSSNFSRNFNSGSGSGGGVYNSTSSHMTIIDGVFDSNRSPQGSAGAIYNSNVMTIENTIVINNKGYNTGGIYNGGIMTVRNSRVTHNEATNGLGGGVTHFNQTTSPSKLTLINTTIDDNLSAHAGGGIFFSGGEATLEATNTTLYSNTAQTIGGGGLYATFGNATLTNVTFHNNSSLATDGDSIENYATSPATVTIRNTLVDGGGCEGAVVDGGGNLQYPAADCGNTIPVADPQLSDLADNGGWIPTVAFMDETSPARNAALNNICPATDQRGVLRPQFNTCDVGAFEWGARPILATIAPTSTLALSPTFTLVVHGSNFIDGPSGSHVLWGDDMLATTFVSGTELHATVAANRIVAGGQVSITVRTPVVDGGVSDHTAIFTIFKRDQTINFGELADRTVDPLTFNLNATASSNLAVSYTATGVCTVAGNTVTLSGDLGTCTITAQQAGNQSYNPAPNVVRSFDVIKRDQTIDFAKLGDRGLEPSSFTISATASSGLAVTFMASGVCTVEGTTVTLTGVVGTCTITAQQAGNDSYNPAPNVAWSFAVTDKVSMHIPQIFGEAVIGADAP